MWLTLLWCCVCARWQADGPDKHLKWTLWTGYGPSGESGQNALRPAAWESRRGAGVVYLLHLLPCPALHLIGQVTCQGAAAVQSYHQVAPTIILITPGSTHLITRHPSPLTTTRDFLFTGIPTPWGENSQYGERPIHPLPFIRQSPPQSIQTMYPFTDPPIKGLHTATTSRRGSSGGRPIQGQWGPGEAGAGGRSPPIGRACLPGGKGDHTTREQTEQWRLVYQRQISICIYADKQEVIVQYIWKNCPHAIDPISGWNFWSHHSSFLNRREMFHFMLSIIQNFFVACEVLETESAPWKLDNCICWGRGGNSIGKLQNAYQVVDLLLLLLSISVILQFVVFQWADLSTETCTCQNLLVTVLINYKFRVSFSNTFGVF